MNVYVPLNQIQLIFFLLSDVTGSPLSCEHEQGEAERGVCLKASGFWVSSLCCCLLNSSDHPVLKELLCLFLEFLVTVSVVFSLLFG